MLFEACEGTEFGIGFECGGEQLRRLHERPLGLFVHSLLECFPGKLQKGVLEICCHVVSVPPVP